MVTNAPGANAEAVADHTVALMLAALRRLVGAAQTTEAVDRMGMMAVYEVRVLSGDPPSHPVHAGDTQRNRMSIETTLDRVRTTAVLAVLRGPDPTRTEAAIDALVAGGITGIEVTFSTPEAEKVIRAVRDRYDDTVLVGAGTVRTPEQARTATRAGAQFLVSPGTDPELVPAMLDLGTPVMAGTLTPSEVMAALRLGVHVVKLFPASLTGPAYLEALRGPFPEVPFMPTGGVRADNLGAWFDAGAVAVGAGGELAGSRDIAAGDHEAIAGNARRFVTALREWRAAR